MGLAAGQARLLTITARKSDCEFQSMRLSHQKIALARDLANLSNEYQNSLNQTKLVYDYYGKGDTTNILNYNTLMMPSVLNDYTPTLVTDSMGRVVLNSKYAAAARKAGIPQEGLGTLPSEATRNNFIQQLAGEGLITDKLASTIQSLPYNQQAGFGGGATVVSQTQDVTMDELIDMLSNYSADPLSSSYNSEYTRGLNLYDYSSGKYKADSNGNKGDFGSDHSGYKFSEDNFSGLSLGDILKGDFVLVGIGQDEYNSAIGYAGGAIDAVVNSSFWETMMSAVEELLDVGTSFSQLALQYARNQIEYMISNQCDQSKGPGSKGCENEKRNYWNDSDLVNFAYKTGGADQEKDRNVLRDVLNMAKYDEYIGMVMRFNCGKGHDDDSDISAVGVNLSNVFKAYLTYVVDFINGINATDAIGNQVYDVDNTLGSSKLVNSNTTFTVKTGSSVASDDLLQSQFYDTLFNQICANGWVEDDNIDDSSHLQAMLQNGMMFISKQKDDYYYYQANYATDNYIKEVSDDSTIAKAEAKYNTEKAKLNAKEETIDLKMKNLDTEISSLTTEYDTVKNTISKNIEKSFKRYSA